MASAGYLALLFAVAYLGERRARAGRSIVTPTVYALSLAVYATSWTFYGSVGRAAETGAGFLPVYLGPTLVAALWWLVLRKVVRISKANRITSIADFIASRYGKSALLGGAVTVVAVVGIVPYVALQLKAISATVEVLRNGPVSPTGAVGLLADSALWIALLLAAFTIVFGARHLDVTERHEGMVAAVAFESVVKLVAFLAAGIFVTFSLYGGLGDLTARAAAAPELRALFTIGADGPAGWFWLTLLSALAVLLLPRQFQVAVVENVDESHIRRALWLFPLYLLVINVFVLPIAMAGLLRFPGGAVDPDMFVLALPLAEGQQALALFVFIGGLSAATAMVIVETIALATMVSNDLVVPFLVRSRWSRAQNESLSGLILGIRRVTIVVLLLLGFAYVRLAGEAAGLVSIGLISFAAVAQFAPAFLLGLYWKRGTRNGALVGLAAGVAVWAYTLLLPSFVGSGWVSPAILADGPFGIAALRPTALLGVSGLDQVSHGMFWSTLANLGGYLLVSLLSRPSAAEHAQARLFVDALSGSDAAQLWRGTASVDALEGLLVRFLGAGRAAEVAAAYADERGSPWATGTAADPRLVAHVETVLGGAIGAASARAVVASVVEAEPLGMDEVMGILDETSQAIAHSRELEEKSRALEAATAELRAANARLTELDRLKDEFVSTVTHELRTPLTSIRSFTEILRDHDVDEERRREFLSIVISESERLTRLINQVLDLSKIESGVAEWDLAEVDVVAVVAPAVRASAELFAERGIALRADLPVGGPTVLVDRDRLVQVLLNLLGNAAKFSRPGSGRVEVALRTDGGEVRVDVTDDGPGVPAEDAERIFERFHQRGTGSGKPEGTGLGLAISRQIVDHHGGRIWVEPAPGGGARFSFTVPVRSGDRPTVPHREPE